MGFNSQRPVQYTAHARFDSLPDASVIIIGLMQFLVSVSCMEFIWLTSFHPIAEC